MAVWSSVCAVAIIDHTWSAGSDLYFDALSQTAPPAAAAAAAATAIRGITHKHALYKNIRIYADILWRVICARVFLFRRFTDTNVHGTGSVKI